jgi:ABC-2 type transport system permease protein
MNALQTFGRLVALDLKLSARVLMDPLKDKSPLVRAGVVLALLLALHAAAWPLAMFSGAREIGPDGESFLLATTRAGVLFVLPWAIASPMSAVARMLAQRGDLDLLFGSPVSARAVLAARVFALGVEAVGAAAILLAPFADVSALQGRAYWLSLYPALFGAALVGASLGLALALLLIFALGPRRARVLTQVGAAVIGASAVLTAQALALLPSSARDALSGALQDSPLLGALTLPERAAVGEPAALWLWLLTAIALYALTTLSLAVPFQRAALLSAGAPAAVGKAAGAARFSASLGAALRRKEQRLLWRDPWLLSQMGLQALYSLPIGFILWRNGGVTGQAGVAFAPTLVVIAGQLAASLAWIALCGEDAPDFIATAPATRGAIERAKLAALAPPVAIVMAAPLGLLALASPRGAVVALVCGVGASVSGALLMLWRQAPARRGLVLRRHSQSKLVAAIEHWLSLCWAAATGLAALGSFTCLAPLALVGLTLWLARPKAARDLGLPATAIGSSGTAIR